MKLGPYRIVIVVAPLIVFGCLVTIFAYGPDHWEPLWVGWTFGTLFAHTAMASAWVVFGPLPLIWRLPLSLIWISLLVGGWTINVVLFKLWGDAAPGSMSVELLLQWLVQVPMWAVALGCGVRLRHRSDPEQTSIGRGQFSMFHLMVSIAIIGCGLTIARLLYPAVVDGVYTAEQVLPFYRLLALAEIIVTMPLLLAAFLPRRFVLATLVTLMLVGLGTIWEASFLEPFVGFSVSVPHVIAINAVTAAWILAFAVCVRLSGYCLVRRHRWSTMGSRVPPPLV